MVKAEVPKKYTVIAELIRNLLISRDKIIIKSEFSIFNYKKVPQG
jgi:hypothetical protein